MDTASGMFRGIANIIQSNERESWRLYAHLSKEIALHIKKCNTSKKYNSKKVVNDV